MFTWSLGWTPSPARLAMTSLAFMLVEVPEPVWKTSIGNWSSNSPSATRSAAAAIRSASPASSRSSSAFTRAAAPLIRPSQRTTGTGTVSPETGKFATALVVSPPHSCSFSCTPILAVLSHRLRFSTLRSHATRSARSAAERDQLPRHGDRVVVGDQEPGVAAASAAAPAAAGRAPPGRAWTGWAGSLVGPQQQDRHASSPGRRRAAGAGPRSASGGRTSPRSARGCRCRPRRRRRGARGHGPPGLRWTDSRSPSDGPEDEARPVGEHPVQAGQHRHPAGGPPGGAFGRELVAPVQPVGHQDQARRGAAARC